MDSSIVYIAIALILYLIVVLFKKVYLPSIKGARGEHRVARRLRRLNKNDYKVYNDIYVKSKGRSIQIDHLVLSVYGIFVIETKTYKGWIFGHENSKYWTQTLFKKKYKIYNPILQNWSHINFFRNISVDFKHLNYFSIIVFAGSAKLKKVKASVPVIYKGELLRTIRKKQEICLTHHQLGKIDNRIIELRVNKKDIKRSHKKYVKQNIKRTKNIVTSHTCPKCGGKLVTRNGKYGDFYACSGFPECRYTKRK